MDFVKNTGGHFTIGENPFRFVGCNMYELAFMGKKTTDLMIKDAYEEGFKVIRFWAFEPLFSQKLHEICDTAGKYELKLIPVLADKWGYMQDYVVNDEWFNSGYKTSYLEFATGIVSSLKDRKEIMIWELINEPSSDSFEVFYNFVKDVSGKLKTVNSNHLFSIGTIGGLGNKLGGELSRFSLKNFRCLYEIPGLDTVSVHDYSYDAAIFERMDTLYRFKGKYYAAKFFERADYYMMFVPRLIRRLWMKKFRSPPTVPLTLKWFWRMFIDKNIFIAKELKKPFYIGEAGYKINLKSDRKKIIENEIKRYFSKGVDGILLWSFEAQGWSKDGHNYGFTQKDGFKEIIKKYNKTPENKK